MDYNSFRLNLKMQRSFEVYNTNGENKFKRELFRLFQLIPNIILYLVILLMQVFQIPKAVIFKHLSTTQVPQILTRPPKNPSNHLKHRNLQKNRFNSNFLEGYES